MDATVGESIVLPCEVSKDSTLHPTFKWFFNGKLIDFSRHDHLGMIGGVRFCFLCWNLCNNFCIRKHNREFLRYKLPVFTPLWTWTQGHPGALWTYRHKSVWLQDLRRTLFNTQRASNSYPQDPLSDCVHHSYSFFQVGRYFFRRRERWSNAQTTGLWLTAEGLLV